MRQIQEEGCKVYVLKNALQNSFVVL